MELLIKRAKKKNAEAFIELMEKNKLSMYKVSKAMLNNNEDIADAIQETILACYKNIDKLKHTKYFKTWMTRILINKCNDIIKLQKNSISGMSLIEESYIENIEEAMTVKECFESLGSEYKLVMKLYYEEGFNSREISEILNINESTIKTRLSRGRMHFKNLYLKNSEGDYVNE